MTAARVDADPRHVERTVTRVVVKRNNPTLLDVYGHWWVEIDGVESYGWWPGVRPVGVAKAMRGVAGVLNGLGGPNGGSLTIDPRHGELADHAFHPVTDHDRSDDQIVAAIRRFARAFDGGWRWSVGPTVNCRSFQADLLTSAGLLVPAGYAHSAGVGCPFLASPRRWRARLARRLPIRRAGLRYVSRCR